MHSCRTEKLRASLTFPLLALKGKVTCCEANSFKYLTFSEENLLKGNKREEMTHQSGLQAEEPSWHHQPPTQNTHPTTEQATAPSAPLNS